MDLFDEFSKLTKEFEKEKIDYALCPLFHQKG